MTEIVKFVNTIIVESAVTSETIVSGVQGPPGATGPQGPAGVAGTAGAQGPQGTPGAVLVNLANSVQVPVSLTSGQALYNYAVGTSTDSGDRLFIGVPSGSGVTGVLVGGKYYTDLLDTATSLASANMLVKRDSTGKLTGDITGNSATASKLSTARAVSLAGDVVANAVNFDGSSNIQLSTSLITQTGLVPGTYGSDSLTPIITVNSKGVITGISTQTTTGSSNNSIVNIPLAADNASTGIVLSGSSLRLLGGTGVTTAASNNTITIGLNNSVTLNSATQTLTNKTISTNSTWAGNTIALNRGGTGSTTGSIVTEEDLTFSSGGTLSLLAGIIDVGGSVLTNLPTPQNDSDAVTKSYADAIAQSLDIKDSVKAATTANISLSGQQSIDGVSVLAGDRVLVKNQTDSSQNGIWIADFQNWYRASDADTDYKVTAGLFTFVEQGTQNSGNGFVLTTSNPIVLDVTGLTFSQFSGGGTLLVGSGLTKTGNTISAVFSGSYTDLTNKPVIPAAQVQSDWNATTGLGVILNKPTLFSGSYSDLTNKPVLFSGSYSDLTNKPAIPAAQVQSDWNAVSGLGVILNKPALFSGSYSDLSNKPALFSGSYSDLTNKPAIPAAQVQSDWNAVSGLGVILNKPALFSGSYVDLTNKPAIPAAQVQTDWNATTGLGAILNKPNFATVATSGSYSDLTNKPALFSGSYSDLTNKPALFSGSYTDLTNKPTIPDAQVQSDWNAVSGLGVILNKPALFSGSYVDLTNKPALFSGSYSDLTNKPAIPAAQIQSDWTATVGLGVILNKPTNLATTTYVDTQISNLVASAPATLDTLNELAAALGNDVNFSTTITTAIANKVNTSALAAVATSGSYSDLTNKPALFSGSYSDLTNKPALFSGSYSDLTNKPAIPAAQVQSDWNAVSGLGVILNKPALFSGSYSDLTNKPAIPAAQVQTDWNATSGLGVILNKPALFSGSYVDLSNKPVLFSGSYSDLTNKPAIPDAQVQSDWNAVSGLGVILNKPALFSGSYSDLTNKPAIPAAQVQSDWNAVSGLGVILNKPALFSGSYVDLTNKPVLFSGSYSDLTNKPAIPAAQVQSDWNAVSGLGVILNKPALFSGSYSDLTNKPTIPAAQVQTDWNATSGLGVILNKPALFSGSYTDLTNKPTIPNAYTLPTATTSVLGGVKVDGTSITITDGVISSSGGGGSLTASGVTAGVYVNPTVTVNTYGQVTAASSGMDIMTAAFIFGG
jgi:hypothetical protein